MMQGYYDEQAVNQPKGTKNESNSQPVVGASIISASCKSTQRYKERKQFTTIDGFKVNAKGCKSTQRYKERKQFTTRYIMNNVIDML